MVESKTRRKTHPIAYILVGAISLFLVSKIYAQSQQDKVREAVVRDELRLAKTGIIFLSIEEKEPDPSFMQRFKSGVLSPSQGNEVNPPNDDGCLRHYIDKKTGQQGQLLGIGSIYWLGPFRSYVAVSHPRHGEMLAIALTSHGWVVSKREGTWII